MKKTTVIVIALALVFTAATAFILHGEEYINVLGKPAHQKPIIVIDAGHGGYDGGAVAADGTVEKEINLNIAKNLRDFLCCAGFEIKMTRESDISTDGSGTEKYIKTSDLNNRLQLMKENPDAIFVSIHLNKFTTSSANGAQVFFSPRTETSDTLANCIQNSIVTLLQPDNKRVIKQGTKSIYILHNAVIPAVIIECGFLSNHGELAKLKDETYQSMMAFSVFCGIMDYYNTVRQ